MHPLTYSHKRHCNRLNKLVIITCASKSPFWKILCHNINKFPVNASGRRKFKPMSDRPVCSHCMVGTVLTCCKIYLHTISKSVINQDLSLSITFYFLTDDLRHFKGTVRTLLERTVTSSESLSLHKKLQMNVTSSKTIQWLYSFHRECCRGLLY